ncbi:MAG TPA: xanthine dehydrogenase family protein subunit M [Candidatus Tumulicola sp.]
MNPFAYLRAPDASSAMSARLRTPGAQYIAGGTNILDLMKDDVERPALLIDINSLELSRIDARDDGVLLGALARMSDVAAHATIRARFSAVAMALDETASPQLRNMGTIGGNLLQRTRCAYFRDPATACNKRVPGSGCGAIGGENRTHAILGTSDRCIATHASDLAVALVAFDAIVHIVSSQGMRTVPIRAFYRLPEATPQLENTLAPGELIAGVFLPFPPFPARSTYIKVRDRAQYEFALSSAAVTVSMQSGMIAAVDFALGGIATVPWHVPAAAASLIGQTPSTERLENAATTALEGTRGYGQNDFKIVLARRTLIRALAAVTA